MLFMFTKSITTLFVLFIVFIIYRANTAALPFFLNLVYVIPFGDKVGHFVLMGILSFLVNLTLQGARLSLFSREVLLGSLIVTIFVVLEELTQIFIPSRTFSLIDLLFDFLGIYSFGRLAVYVLKQRAILSTRKPLSE